MPHPLSQNPLDNHVILEKAKTIYTEGNLDGVSPMPMHALLEQLDLLDNFKVDGEEGQTWEEVLNWAIHTYNWNDIWRFNREKHIRLKHNPSIRAATTSEVVDHLRGCISEITADLAIWLKIDLVSLAPQQRAALFTKLVALLPVLDKVEVDDTETGASEEDLQHAIRILKSLGVDISPGEVIPADPIAIQEKLKDASERTAALRELERKSFEGREASGEGHKR